jgi:ribosome-binding factor A
MDPHRSERLAELLREELDEIINYELADPRVLGAAVTEVLLAPDLRLAEVRLSFSAGTEAAADALKALEHAKAHIRRLLAVRLQRRRLPELRFASDLAVDSPERLKRLLVRMRRGRPRQESSAEAKGGGGRA